MTRRPLLLAALLFAVAAVPALRAQSVSFTVLRRLFPNVEGRLTYAPLVQGADGRFYGTASRGGFRDQGTVFRIDPDGGNFAVLYAFNGPPFDGARPEGGLVQARDGRFYGNTLAGGLNDRGLLFRLDGPGGSGFQPLADFNLGFPGATPTAEPVEGADGFLYGTAEFGGVFNNFGTVFRVDVPAFRLARVAEFTGSPDAGNPAGRLLLRRDLSGNNDVRSAGTFYGATLAGGSANLGAIYRFTPDNGARQLLYSFTGNADGSLPRPLTEGPDGRLYGVTRSGGPLNFGGIFRLDGANDANLRVLYGFNPSDFTGYDAFAELLLASDGNFYGTTRRGGVFDAGTVYRFSPNNNGVGGGSYATILSFAGGRGNDGGYPQAALTQGSDGRLYGVAAGQQGEDATIFRLDLGLPRPRPFVRAVAPVAGNVGDTVAIVGENLVGATAVRFSELPTAVTTTTNIGATVDPPILVPSGPVEAALTVISARYATFTVPDGAVTGPLTVLDADRQPGPASVGTFTVNDVVLPPEVIPAAVTLAATDPVAVRGDAAQPGRIRLIRAGGNMNEPLTIRFKVQAASTARRDVDYQLVNRGEVLPAGTNVVTLPAGKLNTGLEIVPLPGGGTGTVRVKIAAPDPANAYTLGGGTKAVVTIQ